MATERTATCVWSGELVYGDGSVTLESGAAGELPVTWASRTSRAEGMTSPEELIAAAHAACFSMALSFGLSQEGHAAERLEVSATVTLDAIEGVPTITASDIVVDAAVPGISPEAFIQLATEAGKNCPVSRALGPLAISVTANLVEPEPAESEEGFEEQDPPSDEGLDDPAGALELEEGRPQG
jgi:osmotically inducible protein OsmC